MKTHYSIMHRTVATVLAICGVYWALLLLYVLFFPIAGIIGNLIFAPGWAIFAGWWYIALGKPVLKDVRLFWLLSAVINFVYFLLHLEPWKWNSSIERSLDMRGVWWLVVVILSVVCCITFAPEISKTKKSTSLTKKQLRANLPRNSVFSVPPDENALSSGVKDSIFQTLRQWIQTY